MHSSARGGERLIRPLSAPRPQHAENSRTRTDPLAHTDSSQRKQSRHGGQKRMLSHCCYGSNRIPQAAAVSTYSGARGCGGLDISCMQTLARVFMCIMPPWLPVRYPRGPNVEIVTGGACSVFLAFDQSRVRPVRCTNALDAAVSFHT